MNLPHQTEEPSKCQTECEGGGGSWAVGLKSECSCFDSQLLQSPSVLEDTKHLTAVCIHVWACGADACWEVPDVCLCFRQQMSLPTWQSGRMSVPSTEERSARPRSRLWNAWWRSRWEREVLMCCTSDFWGRFHEVCLDKRTLPRRRILTSQWIVVFNLQHIMLTPFCYARCLSFPPHSVFFCVVGRRSEVQSACFQEAAVQVLAAKPDLC